MTKVHTDWCPEYSACFKINTTQTSLIWKRNTTLSHVTKQKRAQILEPGTKVNVILSVSFVCSFPQEVSFFNIYLIHKAKILAPSTPILHLSRFSGFQAFI